VINIIVMPLYIFDNSGDIRIYKARNASEMVKYIRDNLDNFQELFQSIYLTNCRIKEDLKEIYYQGYKFDTFDDDWPKYKKLIIKRIFNRYHSKDILDGLTGDCNDGNTTPYIHIHKIDESEIINLI
jgi:hypothetical protein